jgi:hypothetical protein
LRWPAIPYGQERFENKKLDKNRGCVEKSVGAINPLVMNNLPCAKTVGRRVLRRP